MTADAVVVKGTVEGSQTASTDHGKYELKAAADEHKRQIERTRLEHQLEQERLDNDARRDREARDDAERRHREMVVFWLVVAATVVGLVAGGGASFLSSDLVTQRWGQALVTLIVGGLVGYFTGSKVGK